MNSKWEYEDKYWGAGRLVIGIDEVGVGCFAGPLVACAVVFNPNTPKVSGLNDSKKVTEKKREPLAEKIMDHALACNVQYISVIELNQIKNVMVASRIAMERSLEEVLKQIHYDIPPVVIVDFHKIKVPRGCTLIAEPKMDTKCASVMAASICAKVDRDNYMIFIHEEYPQYDYIHNKGYGTRMHKEAIAKFGLTKDHRTFLNLKPL